MLRLGLEKLVPRSQLKEKSSKPPKLMKKWWSGASRQDLVDAQPFTHRD